MASPVTDPALLAALNGPEPAQKVTDPALLAALEGGGAPAAPAAPAADEGLLHTLGGAVDAVGNGMSFGLTHRLKAAATALDFRLGTNLKGQEGSADYGSNLADEYKKSDEFASAHPVISTAANVAGGLAVPIGVVGTAAKGATLGIKSLIGAGTGGAIGAAGGALDSRDWTDPAQVAKDAAVGGGVGLALGGAMPGVSKIVGAAYQRAANLFSGGVEGMSRGAGAHLVKAVEADGPAAVQARVAELGPDAMLADAGDALLGKAQGASLNSDEGRSILFGAVRKRDQGTNARIQSDVNRALGPAEDPADVTAAIKKHRTAVDSVNYPAALNSAPPVEIAPIMTNLIDQIEQTPRGSMEHKALTNLQDMLTKKEKKPLLDVNGDQVYDKLGHERWHEVPSSHDDAGILHKVKGELDNIIEYDAPGLGVPAGALQRQQGALKQMRGAINSVLEDQVPGYANANRVSAALAQQGEAVNLGTQYLGSGKTTSSPSRFANTFAPLDQEVKDAFAKGSRGEIERVLGTKANDLQALRGELQGEGGWNTAKLATVHGQPAADELVGTVNRNLKFRDTHNKISEGAQTEIRRAAREQMKPSGFNEGDIVTPSGTTVGMALTTLKRGGLKVVNALLESSRMHSRNELAHVLTAQGAQRDAYVQAVVNALNSRQANAATASQVGNAGAVVAALLGKASSDRLRGGPRQKQLQ